MATALTYGTVILFGATLLNRFLAFFNQIVMMKYIGPETVGLFQMIYPIYILLLVVATAGIPVALTKRVAEEAARGQWGNVRQMVSTSMVLLALGGVIITGAAAILPQYLFPGLVADRRAESAFWVLIPSIFFICLASGLRAFCQGMQSMEPPSLASMVEQVIRIASGLSLALWLLPRGIAYAAAGIALGITLGELFGLAALLWLSGPFLFQRLKRFWNNKSMPATFGRRFALRSLWPLAYPVASSRIIGCLMLTLDAFLIPRCLQLSGMTLSEATAAFGSLVGGLAPLITIPTVFTIPLSTSLVSGIAESWALRQTEAVRYRTVKALRLTAVIGWPCVGMILLVGDDVASSLFGIQGMSAPLHILTIGAFFLYIYSTTTGILQGMGQVMFPLVVTVITSALRIFLFIYVASLPLFGLKGIALGYTVTNLVTACLHVWWFRGKLGMSGSDLLHLLRPALAAVAMIGTFQIYLQVSSYLGYTSPFLSGLSGLLALLLYLLLLFPLGSLTREDLRTFPGGTLLVGFFRKN
ncbi:putative polysaccharide biosynthesis protein [Heliobacterium mobile]|nr:polysaccharide biosynthesis protein [Heliobacterium mobile]